MTLWHNIPWSQYGWILWIGLALTPVWSPGAPEHAGIQAGMAAISMCTTYVMACVVYLEKPGIQHALQFVHSDVSLKVQHTVTLLGSFICAGLCCAHAGTAWVTCVVVLEAAAMSGGLPMARSLPVPAWVWVCVLTEDLERGVTMTLVLPAHMMRVRACVTGCGVLCFEWCAGDGVGCGQQLGERCARAVLLTNWHLAAAQGSASSAQAGPSCIANSGRRQSSLGACAKLVGVALSQLPGYLRACIGYTSCALARHAVNVSI